MQGGNSDWSNQRTDQRPNFSYQGYWSSPVYPNFPPSRNGSMSLSHPQSEGVVPLVGASSLSILNDFDPTTFHAREAGVSGLDGNKKSNKPDTFVINFDSMHDPSASSELPNRFCPKTTPEQYHINISTTEPASNSISNSNQSEENNYDVALNSSNENGNNSNVPNSINNNNRSQGVPTLSPEVHSLEKLIFKYFPIFVFLFIKTVFDHREGFAIFLVLLLTFSHANSVVKREIAKRNHRSLLSLSILFVNLFVCTCFIYFVFKEQRLYKSLVFIPPYSQPLSIWDLLWIVGVTDFVLKFITIQIKAGVACFPAFLLPYSARGKWYLVLERISQLYRGIAPIQPWLYYLMEAYQGPQKVIGVFLSLAYMVSKGTELMPKIKLFFRAFWKVLKNVSLGVQPSQEQLDIAGSQCPICHDKYSNPVLLNCKHVFCEPCVTIWFDREQTCPLCRAKIADDPSWRDGATSFFTQFF